MNGYEKRTEKKKDAIVKAARELFSQRGITDVKINEIASKAGVSQVSIYNYFGNKKNLAKEVLASYLDNTIEEYDEILRRKIPFHEKLSLIMAKKHDITAEINNSAISKYAWSDKALRNVYEETAKSKAIPVYIKFIEQGKKEGAINKNIPTNAILAYILSSVAILEQSDYLKTSSEYKMGIIRLFLYGLLGEGKLPLL